MPETKSKTNNQSRYSAAKDVATDEKKDSTTVIQDQLQTKKQKVLAELQQMGFEVEEQNISKGMENVASYRHEEILKIESDAVLMHEITKDIAKLVNDQQEQIDVIGTALNSAVQHTSNGQVQLAEKEKKSSCVIL